MTALLSHATADTHARTHARMEVAALIQFSVALTSAHLRLIHTARQTRQNCRVCVTSIGVN